MSTDETYPRALRPLQIGALVVGVLCLVVSAVGALSSPLGFYQSYLFAWVFWMGLTLGCFALTMMHHAMRGIWGLPILRPLEAGSRLLPLVFVAFIPVVMGGLPYLYPWTRSGPAHDPSIELKAPYLNVPFFVARWVAYFVVWIVIATLLNRWDLQQDRTGDPDLAQKRANLSAPGMVIYVLTITLAVTDWVMSLYPRWHSTIFGLLFVVGQGFSALAAVTLLVLLYYRRGRFAGVVVPQLTRDLGNLLLTFTILWAYLAFSQFLLIWSANLPNEISYYLVRMRGSWWWLGTIVVIGQFFVPFLALLASRTKRVPGMLAFVAGWILLMRILDVYWMVVPGYHRAGSQFSWMDPVTFLGLGGVWVATYLWQLARHPLLPAYDARLQEGYEYVGA